MKRGLLLFLPMALGAVVLAQDTEDAAALVKQLGSEDYAVRETAQKKLVAMGEKAVPALEEALKADDLEVRLRAGRALRAIGAGAKEGEPEASRKPEAAPRTGAQIRGYSMSIGPGKVTVTVTEMVDGEEQKKTYEGKSVEELKEKYPELKEHLDGRFQFRFGTRDDFDMDKFWGEWNRNFDNFDDDIRKWQDETRREVESMRTWLEFWRNQPRQRGMRDGLAFPGALLGVRAQQPTPALDAQLGLKGLGIVVDAVEKETLADRLGIERFDVLLELNGHEIRTAGDVAAALHGMKEGTKASAKVVRRAQQLTLGEQGAASPK